MTAPSGQAAAAKSLTITTGYGGMCLQFVRTCWGVGAKYVDAKTAWAKATKRHAGLAGIPVGAPLFLSHPKSVHGHVLIWLGNGKVRSTNSATGRVSTYDLTTWTRNYGYTVQGRTQDLNGVTLPISPVGKVDVAALQRAVKAQVDNSWGPDTNMRLNLVRSALNGSFPGGSGKGGRQGVKDAQYTVGAATDGSWGPASKARLSETVKAIQRALGVKDDGLWGPETDRAFGAARAAHLRG